MSSKKVIEKATSSVFKIPRAPDNVAKKRWSFSFQYWQQIEYFGLDSQTTNLSWFVSFFDRLKQLSRESIEDFIKNSAAKDYLRFHQIDWNKKNIPITKEEFFKLAPKKFIPEEEEIFQFMISKGKGRVVGFFDRDYVFQIVLMDPEHNVQPSRNENYSVDPTKVRLTEYAELQESCKNFKRHVDKSCSAEVCSVKTKLDEIFGYSETTRLFCLSDFLKSDKIQQLLLKYKTIEGAALEAFSDLLIKND